MSCIAWECEFHRLFAQEQEDGEEMEQECVKVDLKSEMNNFEEGTKRWAYRGRNFWCSWKKIVPKLKKMKKSLTLPFCPIYSSVCIPLMNHRIRVNFKFKKQKTYQLVWCGDPQIQILFHKFPLPWYLLLVFLHVSHFWKYMNKYYTLLSECIL